MPKRLRKEEKVEILGHLPLFESCTKRELGQIATIVTEGRRPAGTVLTRQGQDGGLMFILADGTADVVRDGSSPNGKAKVIGRLGPGDVVGELSLIDGQPRSASVVASTDVHLLELNFDDFEGLLRKSPKFVRALLKALSVRVRQMDALTG